MKRCFQLTAIAVIACTCALAQDSLGDAARQVRADKSAQPHAKIVVDDEVAPLKTRSPFPEISLKGLDNTGDICRSMEDFRKNHKKDEFENAVRDWYDDYDQMIKLYLKEQVLSQERRNDQYNRPQPVFSGDYKKYWEQVQTRQRADELDRRRMSTDQNTINRVQNGLGRVQTYLVVHGYNFQWYRIRHSANDDDL